MIRFCLFVCLGLGVLTASVAAQPYRLIAGDTLSMDLAGSGQHMTLSVNVNGEVRIAGLGGVPVDGLTLDGAEARIAQLMQDRGLFVDPRVSLSVDSYAPVLVAGDVLSPGRFEFLPGMTLAAALALAGGGRAGGLSELEIARARTEADTALAAANLDIAAQVARIARIEAQLAGPDRPVTLGPARMSDIPDPDALDLVGLIAAEQRILANDRDRAWRLQVFWDNELASIAVQRETISKRIAVQSEVLASAMAALETMRDLADRGLQTRLRLEAAEQREADARSRLLELDAARLAAARAVSDAERERVQFLTGRTDVALTGLREARLALAAGQTRYRRALEHLSILSGGSPGALAGAGHVTLVFDLHSPRADRPARAALTPETLILPGETLVVTAVPRRPAADG
jgi:protein involved in polysaccharide export with SLBB domain